MLGVKDTGDAWRHWCHWHWRCIPYRCRWHQWRHASPVSLIPGSKDWQLHRQWHWCCTSRTLKEQSVKKQAISRYFFSIASIQSSKELSNYNKIVCRGEKSRGTVPLKLLNSSREGDTMANIPVKSKLHIFIMVLVHPLMTNGYYSTWQPKVGIVT
jgi:hypothetical protein